MSWVNGGKASVLPSYTQINVDCIVQRISDRLGTQGAIQFGKDAAFRNNPDVTNSRNATAGMVTYEERMSAEEKITISLSMVPATTSTMKVRITKPNVSNEADKRQRKGRKMKGNVRHDCNKTDEKLVAHV